MDSRSNSTLKEYLEIKLGPQHLSPAVVLPITVVYVLIFISGVIGNAVVCLVIVRNSQFQTPTNYYLFSLAISDLLILIFELKQLVYEYENGLPNDVMTTRPVESLLPNDSTGRMDIDVIRQSVLVFLSLPNDLKVYWQQYPWTFGEIICRLRAYVAEMTSYASVLTIVAFTTERYIAVCHPLFVHKLSTLSRAIKIITSIWILACAGAIPFAVYTQINYLDYPESSGNLVEESGLCTLPMNNNDITFPLLHFSTIVFFCLPMTIIIILYIKIGWKLRQSKFSRISYDDSVPSTGSTRKNAVRKSIHKMLIAVVIAFFVCWAPFHAQRLLTANVVSHEDWTASLRMLNEVLYYSAGCLYYFSSTINPILYSLLSVKYRIAFRETLCSFSGMKPEAERSQCRSQNRHSENFMFNNKTQLSVRENSEFENRDKEKYLCDIAEENKNGYVCNSLQKALNNRRETQV